MCFNVPMTETSDPYMQDEFPLTTIRVTLTNGETNVFENAAVHGIWSGRLIVAATEKGEPKQAGGITNITKATVTSTFIPVTEVDRLEFGVTDGYSGTHEELASQGFLTSDDSLDLNEKENQ